MLIIITGGLLFICLILLIIVMLRSKARKRKALITVQGLPVKEEVKPQPEVKKEPVKQPDVEKKTVDVPVKKEEPKPVIEPKKEIHTPVAETKKEQVTITEEIKKETPVIKPAETKTEVKKPEEVSIKSGEKKPEAEVKKQEPLVNVQDTKEEKKVPATNTSIEEKKKEFHKALEETHSKEDNLRILQERLAELGKDKDSFTTKDKSSNEEKVQSREHEKLVDLTSLINEKLKAPLESEQVTNKDDQKTTGDTSNTEVKEEEKKSPETVVSGEKQTVQEEPLVETPVRSVQESEKILTPFFDKLKENEEPEQVIQNIEAELQAAVEEQKTDPPATPVQKEETPVIEQKDPNVTQNIKDPNPKTFTEWLNTLKKS